MSARGDGVGGYTRKVLECPWCKKTFKNLVLHQRACPKRPRSPEDTAEPSGEASGENLTEPSEALGYLIGGEYGDEMQPLPDMGGDPKEAIAAGAKDIGKRVKKFLDKSPKIKKKDFREKFWGMFNKAFRFFEVPYLCFTDEEIDEVNDDVYYLINEYYPEFLSYMNNDAVIFARVFFSLAGMAKKKYYIHLAVHGKITREQLMYIMRRQQELDAELMRPELENIRESLDAVVVEAKARRGATTEEPLSPAASADAEADGITIIDPRRYIAPLPQGEEEAE